MYNVYNAQCTMQNAQLNSFNPCYWSVFLMSVEEVERVLLYSLESSVSSEELKRSEVINS